MKHRIISIFLASFLFCSFAKASEEAILNASNILQLMLRSADHEIPEEIMRNAKAVAIVPNSFRVGFIISGAGGSGIMSVKGGNGWSYPVFITIGGGNIGFQAGVEKSHKMIIFLTDESINQVISNGLKLGSDATVAAGPLGRSKENIFTADVYTYTQGKGLFAGVSLGGLIINIDDKNTIVTYGEGMDARSIISRKVTPEDSYATSIFFEAINNFR